MVKKYIVTCCILITSILSGNNSWAEEWPKDRPIRIIVPQAAGGTNDIITRIIAIELGKALNQSIVIENKPGASGAIGLQLAANAIPDGYTFAIASDSSAILSATRESLSWRLGRDLIGVALIGDQPIGIAVSSQTPYLTLADLLNAAKSKPGTISYGTSGQGTNQHYIGEWLAKSADFKWTHIPYKGGGQAIIDLTGGTTPAAVLGFAPLLSQQKKGGIRILALTSAQRNPNATNVPTLAELGFKDIIITQWVGVVAPKNLPPAILNKVSKEILLILEKPEIKLKLLDVGLTARPMPASEFEVFLKNSIQRWIELNKILKIPVD
ncbi:tripartite tricarboxylate transporter substrate binding protein [Polynucleobacter sp. IMCC30063]|nr:tripartite tricarboxylate transporter substrate binding protein [Polynucleobacter sp. IMCC30063]